jgi:hypothetical protein
MRSAITVLQTAFSMDIPPLPMPMEVFTPSPSIGPGGKKSANWLTLSLRPGWKAGSRLRSKGQSGQKMVWKLSAEL